jgi:glucose/arabinose dehydrogenase
VTRPAWDANRGGSTAVAANEQFIALTNAGYGLVRQIDRRTGEAVAETKAIRAPRGIALARNGDLIVADAAADRLVRVTREGVLDIATGLEHPVGLLLEGDSSAIVSEYRRGSLRRVDLVTGRHVEIVAGLHHPAGVARMKDGRLAIVEPELRRVLAVDPRTGARTVLANGLALSLEGLDLPRDTNAGIVVDSDGAIYVSCPGDNSIIRIAARGDTEPGEYVK